MTPAHRMQRSHVHSVNRGKALFSISLAFAVASLEGFMDGLGVQRLSLQATPFRLQELRQAIQRRDNISMAARTTEPLPHLQTCRQIYLRIAPPPCVPVHKADVMQQHSNVAMVGVVANAHLHFQRLREGRFGAVPVMAFPVQPS